MAMLKNIFLGCILLNTLQISQCDITNLNEFLNLLESNPNKTYPIGFLSQANGDVVKRYLRSNIQVVVIDHTEDLLKAVDDGTIHAAIMSGKAAADFGPQYHVFSSLIISPQAMLLAPDFIEKTTPYGLKNQSSHDLFDALNAAIAEMQRDGKDETLIEQNNRTDLVRVYTCQQDQQMRVPNRNETTGFLREILLEQKPLLIGGLGPKNWGIHDGNYQLNQSNGFYMKLLDVIVEELGQLKGPDGISYSNKIEFQRKYYNTATELLKGLLDGEVHATDVYLLIQAAYTGSNEVCAKDNNACRSGETCVEGLCSYPARSRSLHFRTTCTTASHDTKFITKNTNPAGAAAAVRFSFTQ